MCQFAYHPTPMKRSVSQIHCLPASELCLFGGSRTTVIAKIFGPLLEPIFSPLRVILPTLRVPVLGDFVYLLFSLAPAKCSAPDGSRATSCPKLCHRTSENSCPRSLGWCQPLEPPQNGQVSALPCCLWFRVSLQSVTLEQALCPPECSLHWGSIV